MQSVTHLENILANTYALYLKTQNYHWNIKGAHFFEYHKMLEDHYQEMAEAVDEIAENISMLGFRAPGSFKEFQELQIIADAASEKMAQDMLKELAGDHDKLNHILNEAMRGVDTDSDQVVIDLLVRRMTAHRKYAWMLSASTK